jgi:hypothetical protein
MAERTEKQKAFLAALFSDEAGGDVRRAMDIAGYSRATACNEVTGPLTDDIFELTKTYLSANGPLAAYAVQDIIKSPDVLGNREKLAAAKDVLDRAGHKPREEVSMEVDSPLFILPAKDERA